MPIITKIESCTVRVPLDKPVSFSTRRIDGRFYTLVRIICNDGSVGHGFCHAGSQTGVLTTIALREVLSPLAVGCDSFCNEFIWQRLYQESLLNGRAGAVMRAISAIDIALWDRNARSAGLPLWRYLGSARQNEVPCYASGGYYWGGSEVENIAEEVTGYRDAGYTAVKIKIGGLAPSEDADRVRVAREILGPNALLMLDANNAWSDLPSAIAAIRPLLCFDPFFIEEPFGPEDFENMTRLGQMIPVPIAAGELLAGRWAHTSAMQNGSVSLLQPDAAVCGGITEWRKIAAAAAARGIAVASHSFPDFNAHLVASAANGMFVEYFTDQRIFPFTRLIDEPIIVGNGLIKLSERPGLGFNFVDAEIRACLVDDWS
jgi:L-alanine-DL-glutamate epimerase-like enolase superfamily enzyme